MKCQFFQKSTDFANYSLALDESTDISDTAQLSVFIRGIDNNVQVTEEVCGLASMKGQTTGAEIFLHLCGLIDDLLIRME